MWIYLSSRHRSQSFLKTKPQEARRILINGWKHLVIHSRLAPGGTRKDEFSGIQVLAEVWWSEASTRFIGDSRTKVAPTGQNLPQLWHCFKHLGKRIVRWKKRTIICSLRSSFYKNMRRHVMASNQTSWRSFILVIPSRIVGNKACL